MRDKQTSGEKQRLEANPVLTSPSVAINETKKKKPIDSTLQD
jgi:hypothetical protein